MPTYYDEKKGTLPFADAHGSHVDQLDFSEFRGTRMHWLFKLAMDNAPNEVGRFFEENGYEYRVWAQYDPETQIMTTNQAICPARNWHHLGSTCPVCGLEG